MRGDKHSDKCAIHRAEHLILTTSGTQAVCPLFECTYFERTDRDLRVTVKKTKKAR